MKQQANRPANLAIRSAKGFGPTSSTATYTSPKTAPIRLDRQDIAMLAYRYWTERGCPEGSPERDWFRAEAELRALTAITAESAAAAANRTHRASAGS